MEGETLVMAFVCALALSGFIVAKIDRRDRDINNAPSSRSQRLGIPWGMGGIGT